MVNNNQLSEKDSHPIELHNREVTDMFGEAPNWLIHSGSYILYGVLILFLAGTAIISYPDAVSVPIIIDDIANVEWITANSSGQIDTFLVENNSLVKPGDTIGILQNMALLEDVNKFCSFLNNIEDFFQLKNVDVFNNYPSDLQMGEMTDAYNKITKAVKNWIIFENNNYYAQRKSFLQKELAILQREPEKNEIAILKLENDIFELYVSHQTEIEENKEQLELAYEDMMNNMQIWESKYLIRSSSEGRIFLGEIHSLTRIINNGDTIGTVISNNKKEYIGSIEINQEQVVGISVGDQVNIRLAMYPEQSYGILIGKVSAINFIPYNKRFMIDIKFPNQLLTTSKKEIKYDLGLKGEAEIITSNRSVLSRIFSPIFSLFKENGI